MKAQNSDIVVKSVKSDLNVFIPINKFSILLIQHSTIKFPRKFFKKKQLYVINTVLVHFVIMLKKKSTSIEI